MLVRVADTTGAIDGSLGDTANILVAILGKADQVESVLEDAQNAKSLGTEGIPIRVDRANDVLQPVRDDTKNIVSGLKDINKNLEAICNSPLLILLPPQQC